MNRSSKDHRESYLRRREVPEYRRNYSSAWCDPRNEMAATAETEAGPCQKKPPVSAPDVHAAAGWAIRSDCVACRKIRRRNANPPDTQRQILTVLSQFFETKSLQAKRSSLVTLTPD